MIDKKSLRIGNLVALAHESNAPIVTVAQIKNRGVVWKVDGDNGYSGFELLMPIELTPDWMDKFNFKTPDNYQPTVLYREGLMIDLHIGKYRLRDYPRTPLDHVHQLQGLFFYLTGEELTINGNENRKTNH